MKATIATPLGGVLATWCSRECEGAKNFKVFEMQVGGLDGLDRFVVTIRRANGETVEEQYLRLRAEMRAAAREGVGDGE